MNTTCQSRRQFLKSAAALGALPLSLVELSFADEKKNFSFAYISDAHIQQIKGSVFVNNWDRGLIRAASPPSGGAELTVLLPLAAATA